MKQIVGWVGLSAAAVGIAVAMGGGGAAVAADGDGAEVQSSLVEDFAYPGADAILAEHGLKVTSGDGHILFEPSTSGSCVRGLIKVETHVITEGVQELVNYCFRTSGTRGFLNLEVPATAAVRGGDKPLQATALLESGVEKTFNVPVNRTVEVDVAPAADEAPQAILLELRFGAW